jgi:hypothetical protein
LISRGRASGVDGPYGVIMARSLPGTITGSGPRCSVTSTPTGVAQSAWVCATAIYVPAEPRHPSLLIGGLDGARPVVVPDPGDSLSGIESYEHGHASEHGPGPAEASEAADLDGLAGSRARKGPLDLSGSADTVGRQAEVRPVDDLGRPGWHPPHVHVEAEVATGVVRIPLEDRRRSNLRSIGERYFHRARYDVAGRYVRELRGERQPVICAPIATKPES